MSVPMYVLVTEEDYSKATDNEETIAALGPDEECLIQSRDFEHYASYISSVNIHETRKQRTEAATEIATYLNYWVEKDNPVAKVDANGILCLVPDTGIRYAAAKIERLNNLMKEMTPEHYAADGEYKIRQIIRNQNIFAYPYDYDNMFVGEHLQTMDAFIRNLYFGYAEENEATYRFVVTQTFWLHD